MEQRTQQQRHTTTLDNSTLRRRIPCSNIPYRKAPLRRDIYFPPPPLAFLPSQSAGLYASDISNIWGLEAEEAEDPEREIDASSARNGELHACATCRI